MILLAFVFLVTVTLLFINSYFTRKLTVQLKAADALYRIDFSKAELHVLQAKVLLRDITLTPDTAALTY